MYLFGFDKSISSATPTYAEATPQWDVDCKAAPYDLRPAVNAIMATENWLLERMPEGQKLVILMGEHHPLQTHVMLQQAVIAAHLKQSRHAPRRRFSFGYEEEHNLPFHESGARFPDPNGRIFAESFASYNRSFFSYEAKKNLFGYCVKENVSISFNDIASVDYGTYIDQDDPHSKMLVERYRHDLLGTKIERSISKDGMALSNFSIVQKAIEHMKRTEVDIYIQQCGQAHCLGDKSEYKADYRDSLAVRFKEHGFTVLPVLVAYEDAAHYLPDQAKRSARKAIKISHLADGDEKEFTFEEIRGQVNRHSCLNL